MTVCSSVKNCNWRACVCVCACVRACVRVRVCEFVRLNWSGHEGRT